MKVSELRSRIDSLIEAREISEDDDVIALADEFDEFYQCHAEHVYPLDMATEISQLEHDLERTEEGTHLHKWRSEKKAKYEAFTKKCLVI